MVDNKKKKQKQTRKSKPKKKVNIFLKGFGYTFAFVVIYIIAVDFNFLWLFGKSPSVSELQSAEVNEASRLYSADGVLLGKYYNENRVPVEYEKISPIVIKALVATEDVRFYEHSGIDLQAWASVLWYAIKGDQRGGSTITQQLAKNLFKTRKDVSKGLLGYVPVVNTIIYKSKEWITAYKLERHFSKKEILTMYLNTVDFGSNTFGIKTAAKTFFNTPTDKIKTEQAAMLVGMLKAPTYYSPVRNKKNALKRRNTVLAQMVKYDVISSEEYERLKVKDLGLDYHVEQHYEGQATYFRGVANNFLKQWCKENGYDLYSSGLKIYTTIDSRMQKYAEEAVQEHMSRLQKRFEQHINGSDPWVDERNRPLPRYVDSLIVKTEFYKNLKEQYPNKPVTIAKILNTPRKMTVFTWKGERDTMLSPLDSIKHSKKFLHAGFMSMDPKTGHIKAWVGGINYKHFKYDHVKQAKRQPGSTFKAFVYAAALDNGYCPCDRVVDGPVTINYVENGEDKSWTPKNADWYFSYDSMTLRHAMAMSINVVAAKMTQKIGWEKVIEYAHKCGIKSKLANVPSIGLGPSEVNLYELVGAYGTFMNNGVHTEPVFITRIEDKDGKVIKEFTPKTTRALSEETAYLMQTMLRAGVEEGGTTSALWEFPEIWPHGKIRNELGGKTGTSSNYSDGWFVGVSKDLVGGVWVGGDDRCIHFRSSTLGEGAKTALPIYGRFMEKVYKDTSLGITFGPFPKAKVKINKQYNCHTSYRKREMKDSTDTGVVAEEVISEGEGL